MNIKPPQNGKLLTVLPNNPTDEQRHEMLQDALAKAGRPEDYGNIVRLLSLPQNITCFGNPGELKGTKVGIIGGGLAGMSAAFELRKLGYDITIFEPNTSRIGGRVYTYYFDRDKRLYGEFGAMRIPVSHEAVWQYINFFKLDTEPIDQSDPNTFTYVRNIRVRNGPKRENIFHNIYPLFDLSKQEAKTPWPELLSQVSRYYLATMPPEVRMQFLMVIPRYDNKFENIINMSIRGALKGYGLSDEAINLIVSVMPILGATIESSYETALNDEYTTDYSNLYRISGGMVNLPLAFYKSLNSPNPLEYQDISQDGLGKVTWKGGCGVYGIHKSDIDGKVILKYRPYPTSYYNGNLYESFDYVIFAIPMSLLRLWDIQPLFSGRKMESIRDVVYQDAQKTLILCKERFWEKQGILGGASYTDTVINLIGYPTRDNLNIKNNVNHSWEEPGVLLASYNIGQDAIRLGHTTPVNQYRFIREWVEKVHGLPNRYLDKIVSDVKTVDWYQETWAKGAFQMLTSGLKTDFLYVSSTPEYDNRVFFAGEHTSAKNAWIQGALHSGARAANEVAYYSTIHKYQK